MGFLGCGFPLKKILGLGVPVFSLAKGDEATANNESWLHLLWVSDHSPNPTNSLVSRNVIAVIPSSRYVYDEETGRNMTVQTALHAVVNSFNQLSTVGAQVVDPISKEVEL